MIRLLLGHSADEHSAFAALRPYTNPHRSATSVLRNCLTDHHQSPTSRHANFQHSIQALEVAFGHEFEHVQAVVAASRRAIWPELLKRAATLGRESVNRFDTVAERMRALHPGPVEERHAWSSGFVRKVGDAWQKCLVVLRRLMRGRDPETLDGVLLFLALARSAPWQSSREERARFDDEFARDLSRWQVLFPPGSVQLQSFQNAVMMLFGVDVTSQTADPNVTLETALLQFRALANQLLKRHNDSDFGDHAPGDTAAFFIAHAQCITPSHGSYEDGIPCAPEHASSHIAPSDWGDDAANIAAGTHPEEFRHCQSRLMPTHHGGVQSLPVSLGSSSAVDRPNLAVILVLAGVAFAIILVFLLSLREIMHGSLTPYGVSTSSGIFLWTRVSWAGISHTDWLAMVTSRTISLMKEYLEPPDESCTCSDLTTAAPASTGAHADLHHTAWQPASATPPVTPHPRTGSLHDLVADRGLPQSTHVHTIQAVSAVSTPQGAPALPISGSQVQTPATPLRNRGQRRRHPGPTPGSAGPVPRGSPLQGKECHHCGKLLAGSSNLGKHIREVHDRTRYDCEEPGCGKNYARHDTLIRHVRKKHHGLSP
ncbi:hypothetical protein Micbo1qcDRAFT_168491 [Microdochium bolleyi]|uniref:C2H2-type domain-containing protein n=1 Tax=Microdochium bolleyi TaxID=196109 RepID=A0A136INE8_9PEZI|nr:hypothetical protein Micbo1qcDRAFT_168491 [Microdochium bolleyi]